MKIEMQAVTIAAGCFAVAVGIAALLTLSDDKKSSATRKVTLVKLSKEHNKRDEGYESPFTIGAKENENGEATQPVVLAHVIPNTYLPSAGFNNATLAYLSSSGPVSNTNVYIPGNTPGVEPLRTKTKKSTHRGTHKGTHRGTHKGTHKGTRKGARK